IIRPLRDLAPLKFLIRRGQCLVNILPDPAEEFLALERHGFDPLALHRERSRAADGDAGLANNLGLLSLAGFALAVAAALGVEVPPEPAIAGGGSVRGLPDVHRLEVGAVGIRIADALYDRGQAVVVELLDPAHLRMQAHAEVTELQDILCGD